MTATLAPFAWHDWLALFAHYLLLSLLSVGGAISTLPEMHRYLVGQQHWLNDAQFNAAVALGQAAPGPNILFVALLGWQIGMQQGSPWLGLAGALTTLCGVLLPSTMLTFAAARWSQKNHARRSVRAFKTGLASLVVGLLLSTAWILAQAQWQDAPAHAQHASALLVLLAALLSWRTRLHLLWLLACGAAAGAFGLLG